jgi:predicted tellurium resistance membrane protein TerC
MQYQYDLGKPNRDYTQTIIRKKLWVIWLVFSCLLFMLVFWLNPKIGLVYGWLLLINWINYQFLLDRWEWRVYLPLFKYPVIYLVFFQNYVELGEINDNVSLMLFRIILAISVLIGFVLLERFSEKSNQLKYAAYAFLIIIGGVSFFLGTQISVEV